MNLATLSSKVFHKSSYTLFIILCSSINNAEAALDAYITKLSVTQGERLSLLVSSDSPDYQYKIFKFGKKSALLFTSPLINAVNQTIPSKDAWKQNLNWKSPQNIIIPANWTSGLYQIKIISGVNSENVNFRVREKNPGTTSRILLIDNSTTEIAYNNWGGKSLYTFNSTANIAANHLSLARPNNIPIPTKQYKFIAWADQQNIPLEYASMLDLDTDPNLLKNYKLIVFVGHNEYWSKEMRDNYDKFVATGGNALIMGGNTMWWQIRIEKGHLVGYKNGLDPIINTDPVRTTVNWINPVVNYPENQSIGVSFRQGGYVNAFGFYLASNGYGGYTVTDQNHWMFTNTGLLNGDTFGQAETIVGYEVDGVDFIWLNGIPVLTGNDGAPSNFKILAYSPAATAGWAGFATLGLFQFQNKPKNGGTVVNMATVDWADGLWNLSTNSIANTKVSQITLNVLKHFKVNLLPPFPDLDGDGIYDDTDNCISQANTTQIDTDKDGYGNLCDADFDNNGLVNSLDLTTFKSRFMTNDPDADLNADGIVNSLDLTIFKSLFFKPPGPAAIDR